jgi:DNA-binding XRE family transcriptional regulator
MAATMTMQPDEMKAIRKRLGMTQADFGEAIGMSRKAVNEMEAGKAVIERRTELAVRYLELTKGA